VSGHVFEALRLLARGLDPIVELPGEKKPLHSGWQKHVNRTAEEVRADFESAPEGAGIGTVTGRGFIVADLDRKNGVDGVAALATLPPLPATLASITPSGGRHLFLRLPSGVEVKNSVSKLALGVDIRGTGGQVVLPPTVLPAGQYRWDETAPDAMAELPASWVELLHRPAAAPERKGDGPERIRAPGDRDHAKKRASLYLAKCDHSVAGQGGHNALFNAACRAVELCLHEDDVLEVLREYNARSVPPWEEHDLQRKVREALKLHALGSRFDEPASPEAGQPAAGDDPAPSAALLWVEELQAYVARARDGLTWNIGNPLGKEAAVGVLVKAAGKTAAAARLALQNWDVGYAKRIDLDPARPAEFKDEHGHLVVNNYVPPTLVPKAGAWPVLDEVLTFLVAGDPGAREWVLNWCAAAAQFPGERLKTSPVFHGNQGSGKTPFSLVLSAVLGERNCFTARNDDVHGRFNSHFAQKLLLIVDELRTSEAAEATARLKYLTGSPRISVEAKGAAAFDATNRLKVMCASNETFPLRLDPADTRWAMFKNFAPVTDEYRMRMAGLFTSTASGTLNEKGAAEAAAFAHALLSRKVDRAMLNSPYDNEARAAALLGGRDSVEQFADAVSQSSIDAVWMEKVPEHERTHEVFKRGLDLPGHPTLTGHAAVYATYRAFCRASELRPIGTGRFAGELARHRAAWFAVRPNVYRADGKGRDRVNAYDGIPRDRAARGARFAPVTPAPAPEPQLALPEPVRAAVQALDIESVTVTAAPPGPVTAAAETLAPPPSADATAAPESVAPATSTAPEPAPEAPVASEGAPAPAPRLSPTASAIKDILRRVAAASEVLS
jgi:hypothetical protein